MNFIIILGFIILLTCFLETIWAGEEGLTSYTGEPVDCGPVAFKKDPIQKSAKEEQMIKVYALLLDPNIHRAGVLNSGSAAPTYNPIYSALRDEALRHTISLNKDGIHNKQFWEELIGTPHKIQITKRICVVVQGWADRINRVHLIDGVVWMFVVGADWRHYGHCHVFIVDWGEDPNYFDPIVVGTKIHQVAELLKIFLDLIYKHFYSQLSKSDFFGQIQVAGDQLGAQISGILGKNIKKSEDGAQLAAIYGLEPDDYFFQATIYHRSDQLFFYLKKDCARMVMTVHIAMGSVLSGIRRTVGHYSFYAFVDRTWGKADWCTGTGKECNGDRASQLFRAGMKPQSEFDSKLIGFKCNNKKVDRTQTSLFGIHHTPEENGEGIYYLPIGICSSLNYIPVKDAILLPSSCSISSLSSLFFGIFPENYCEVKFKFEMDKPRKRGLLLRRSPTL